jgi:hypothetical protein
MSVNLLIRLDFPDFWRKNLNIELFEPIASSAQIRGELQFKFERTQVLHSGFATFPPNRESLRSDDSTSECRVFRSHRICYSSIATRLSRANSDQYSSGFKSPRSRAYRFRS